MRKEPRQQPLSPAACYEVLGLPIGSSHADVQEAYRRLAFRHHPDIAGDDPIARYEFSRITNAYKTISALDRLREHSRRAGCCERCGAAADLCLGMDRKLYCPACLLEKRRRLLPAPVMVTIRCLSVITLQGLSLLAVARAFSTGAAIYATLAALAAAASLVVLGYFVFTADRIEN